MKRKLRSSGKIPPTTKKGKSPQLKIEFREPGTLDEHERTYLAYIGKFIIEFSKAEHNLDEAIMSAFSYDRKTIVALSRNFPATMKDKLQLMVEFCRSEPAINRYTAHLQNRLDELSRAMELRNALCHGYLDLVKLQGRDIEFRFTRWTRGDEKYHITNVSHLPKLSQIKKSTKALYVWKALFGELERSIQSLSILKS